MNNKGYISKLKKGTSLYETLHEEALEILQKLSGSIWTDYNEHDPGVTLVENIAYAITEVAHKIKLPIQDILKSAKGSDLTSGDNALFEAAHILTTNPVTCLDYRKLWIDQISNVKNVWVNPVSDYKNNILNSKGALQIYVEKYEYKSSPEAETLDNEHIITAIQQLYNTHRNLCETLYSVEIYKALNFSIDLKITLLDLVDGEEILATILYEVNNYLAPEVGYYALQQLKAQNETTNTIFNGPHLENGFIKDDDLKAPVTVIEVAEIIKLISKIPGIVNINTFALHYVDAETNTTYHVKERFKMPKNTTARVLFPIANTHLFFENSGVSFQPDLKETKKQLAFIQALDTSKFKAASSASNTISIPKGQNQDINYYYPIRKQLPELYGVGDVGISRNASPLRAAQTKQLKGYLLPFDQVLNNFLAQLCNIYTLFDVANHKGSSYFTKTLPDVRDLIDLIAPPYAANGTKSDDDIISYWTEVTNNLNAFFDHHATDRLHKMADHLLARFGEQFNTFALYKINNSSYGTAVSEATIAEQLFTAKQELIKNYDAISYGRAKSFNYQSKALLPENDNTQDVPGIIKKIGLLMGMSNFNVKSLTKAIASSGLQWRKNSIEVDVVVKEIDIYMANNTEAITLIEDVTLKPKTEDNLFKYMHFVGHKTTLLEQVLSTGIQEEHYSIKHNPKSKHQFYVVHKRTNEKANIVHIAKSEKLAKQAITKTISHLVNLSIKSEGLFMLEHTLLLPSYFEKHFGFEINLGALFPELNLAFTQHTKYTFADRNTILETLINGLITQQLRFEITPKTNTMCISILNTENEILAISKPNEKLTSKVLEHYIIAVQQTDFTGLKEDLEALSSCYVYYNEHAVNETFFSFRMSFILPSWPVRFQNANFRNNFENTCYEEVPIHIQHETYWVNYENMLYFETYYFKWLSLLQQGNTGKDFIYHAYKLIKVLHQIGAKS